MIDVNDVIKVALSQVGYVEKASNAQLDSFTANAGSANYQKYGRDLFNAGYYNGNKNGYEWCDQFVDWCFWMAAGKDKKAAEAAECQTGTLGAGCTYSRAYYKAQGRLFSTPQVGDQAFFSESQRSDPNNADHTGIVVAVNGNKVTVVEGNKSNRVEKNTYTLGNGWIYDFGHPKFDKNEPTKEEPKQPITPTPVNKVEPTNVKSIKNAQTFLNSYGNYGLDVDGEWGPLSNSALTKALQKAIGTEADGIVGPNTKAAIRRNYLYKGKVSTFVKVLQCALVKHGYSYVEIDGDFGTMTDKAVRDFQTRKKLEVDGVVGEATWIALLA